MSLSNASAVPVLMGSPLQGFHKIVKKHDKMLPHAPCQQFYVAHLHHQPWVQVSFLASFLTSQPTWVGGGGVELECGYAYGG